MKKLINNLTFSLLFLLICTIFFNITYAEAQTVSSLHNPIINSCHGTTWNTVYFGNYYQSDKTGEKKEPILWRVLQINGQEAFLLADKNLDTMPWHDEEKPSAWEQSTLRNWLNTTFMNTAFTKQEQSAMVETTVTNAGNSFWDAPAEKTTKDKVWLLSLSEASSPSYGFYSDPRRKNDARKAYNTAYLAGKLGMNTSKYGDVWWLRTGGYYSDYATRVNENGYADIYGVAQTSKKVAVRPCIRLNLAYWRYWKKGPDANSNDDISFSIKIETTGTPQAQAIATPKNVTIVSIRKNRKNKTVKIKYKKQKNVTGYQLQYGTNKKFRKKQTKYAYPSSSSVTIKNVKKKRYYVRIRAYISKSGTIKYGKWSKVKSFKL